MEASSIARSICKQLSIDKESKGARVHIQGKNFKKIGCKNISAYLAYDGLCSVIFTSSDYMNEAALQACILLLEKVRDKFEDPTIY